MQHKSLALSQYRNTHKSQVIALEDSSHLWAISYADFLMVLLSFFAIFFSTDEANQKRLVMQLASDLHQVDVKDSKPAPPTVLQPDLSTSLSNSLKHALSATTQVESTTESIMVDFPDNIFASGQVELTAAQETELRKILDTIKPHINSVYLGFIGHADAVPVSQRKHKVLSNNYDISVVRASKAMKLAVEYGLPSDHLYASGSGENVRKSRSISVSIKTTAGGHP